MFWWHLRALCLWLNRDNWRIDTVAVVYQMCGNLQGYLPTKCEPGNVVGFEIADPTIHWSKCWLVFIVYQPQNLYPIYKFRQLFTMCFSSLSHFYDVAVSFFYPFCNIIIIIIIITFYTNLWSWNTVQNTKRTKTFEAPSTIYWCILFAIVW